MFISNDPDLSGGDVPGEQPEAADVADMLFEWAAGLSDLVDDEEGLAALVSVCNRVRIGNPEEGSVLLGAAVLAAVCRLSAEAMGADPVGILRAGVREAVAEFEEHFDGEERV